jgi:hypothetical protein
VPVRRNTVAVGSEPELPSGAGMHPTWPPKDPVADEEQAKELVVDRVAAGSGGEMLVVTRIELTTPPKMMLVFRSFTKFKGTC